MSPDPVTVFLSDRRSIAIVWSQRAMFRLGELRPPPQLGDLKTGGGFGFLVKHLWVCLADEADRRRFPAPEDLASEMPEDELLLRPIWRAMWKVAFAWDPEAPPPPEDANGGAGSAAAEGAPRVDLTEAQKKSAGAGSSPSPSSSSG